MAVSTVRNHILGLLISVVSLAACTANSQNFNVPDSRSVSNASRASGDKSRPEAVWVNQLQQAIKEIEVAEPGELGVYLERLSDGSTLKHGADRPWYLASAVKVPIAVVLLKEVELGSLALNEKIVLQDSDFVDGSGDLFAHKAGESFTLKELLEKMLTLSDSSATDMLIRRIGIDKINSRLKSLAPGFGSFTTLLQVRHDAYGELHPDAEKLTNWDFIELKRAKSDEARVAAFMKKLQLKASALRAKSLDDAFESYYRRGLNSGTLAGFGVLLKKLVRGELLSRSNTELVLSYMERMSTGENRIKAGLPRGLKFAQKTGTQNRRVCNVGIIAPKESSFTDGFIVAACAEKFDSQKRAEAALKKIGEAIGRTCFGEKVER